MFVVWRQSFHGTCQRLRLIIRQPTILTLTDFGFACSREGSNAHAGIESSQQMQKLLTKKGAKTKRKWYQPHIAEPMELSGRQQRPGKKGVSESQGHRARQLSHVLYSRICQIANSGELSEELLTKQVLFTQVKMHPTLSGINVYWDANRSDAADIQALLNTLSGKLRSLLISYHVLGRIPSITFVRDRSKGDMTHLNQLFEMADYGPDYVPRGPAYEGTTDLHMTAGDTSNRQDSWRAGQNTETLHHQPTALTLQSQMEESAARLEVHNGDSLGDLSFEAGWCAEPPHTHSDNGVAEEPHEQPFSFRSDLYGLQRDDLMRKVVAQKKKLRYQNTEGGELCSSPSPSEIRDYSKMKVKAKAQEKMLQQRDSTKMKQRLLEQEFDEVQSSLQDGTADEDCVGGDNEYDDYEADNDWSRK